MLNVPDARANMDTSGARFAPKVNLTRDDVDTNTLMSDIPLQLPASVNVPRNVHTTDCFRCTLGCVLVKAFAVDIPMRVSDTCMFAIFVAPVNCESQDKFWW